MSKFEAFQHLFQHLKGKDNRLFDTLNLIMVHLQWLSNEVNALSAESDNARVDRWIPTITPPNGVIVAFYFESRPKYIAWNGTNRLETIGYTLSTSGPYFIATLTSGIPQAGDEVKAKV